MEITARLSLSESERKELARILDCSADKLAEQLRPFAAAATTELLTMALGQKVFTRGSDILEYRLFLLIQMAFGGILPTEQQVTRLFQTTTAGSRALLRAVMSKYQYQLQRTLTSSLTKLLGAASKEQDGVRTISVLNLNLVEELNRLLADADTTLPAVTKRRGAVSTYDIPASSYAKLLEKLNA
jgi:hypothetical protein